MPKWFAVVPLKFELQLRQFLPAFTLSSFSSMRDDGSTSTATTKLAYMWSFPDRLHCKITWDLAPNNFPASYGDQQVTVLPDSKATCLDTRSPVFYYALYNGRSVLYPIFQVYQLHPQDLVFSVYSWPLHFIIAFHLMQGIGHGPVISTPVYPERYLPTVSMCIYYFWHLSSLGSS